MGYDLACLAENADVDEELVCKVCYGLLEKPRMMCAEGHAFCQSCWCQWLACKRTCPTCRGVIDEATPLIKNRIAERMVGELVSYCPFRKCGQSPSGQRTPEKRKRRRESAEANVVSSDGYSSSSSSSSRAVAGAGGGCEWSGKLRDLEAHIETCAFALKPCKVSPLCTVSLPRGLIAEHERSCPHLRTLCVRCGRLVRVAAMQHHQKSSKCHRAQSLLADYLELLKHTAACVSTIDHQQQLRISRVVNAADNPTLADSPTLPNIDEISATESFQSDSPESCATAQSRKCSRPDCLKMETLLKHYAKCSSREEGAICPSGICDHITLLLQLHARDCTVVPYCPVPFCMQWRNFPATGQTFAPLDIDVDTPSRETT